MDEQAFWNTGLSCERIQQALNKWNVDLMPADLYRFMDVDDPDLKLILDAFDIEKAYEGLGGEYAILIKLHPFCKERFEIPNQYSDVIIDMSEEDELNDLLFVTDLLVTDYSSVIFEASLLNIPMMFYAFDLYDYIASRDFYYDFEGFVPGKIVFSENELINCINAKDFESEKVNGFKNKFFDDLDGKSSKRVADLILKNLDI